MTLTLKTAKHAIGRYGKIFNIVDDADPLSAYNVTREEAFKASKSGVSLKPCIVVTTAREALEAAWELAHVPEGGIIPANSTHLRRDREDGRLFMSRAGTDLEATDSYSEHRFIDPPTPKPEPWELSRYCHADGDIYMRFHNLGDTYWMRHGDRTHYRREDLAKLNPKPIDIRGEAK